MSVQATGAPMVAENDQTAGSRLQSRFHVAAIAFLRAKQLLAGARPRVDSRGHKLITLALLEVFADTISWHVESAAVAPEQQSSSGCDSTGTASG